MTSLDEQQQDVEEQGKGEARLKKAYGSKPQRQGEQG
jgi:hypothetical protein